MRIDELIKKELGIPFAHTRPKWEETYLIRQARIKREGSQYFTWLVPATAAAAFAEMDIFTTFPLARKYEPLDWIEIANNDTVDITVFFNSTENIPVPAGVIRQISRKAVWKLRVRNDDAAAASTLNLIIITLRREPKTIDKWASEH